MIRAKNKRRQSNKLNFLSSFLLRFSFLVCLFFIFGNEAKPQIISGTVTDEQNAPVVAAEILLLSQNKTISRLTSDAEGKFSLEGKGEPNLILRVSAKGFALFERQLNNLNSPLTIVLSPANLREEVTVSITRTETRLAETPASVVVLDREILETTAAQTSDEILRQVAGFGLFRRSSSKTSNPTAQGANFRGLAGSGASRAAILFDGLSLNDAFGGWTYWSRVPRAAVEQIEVLRGGASAFYGNSALSGAVNFLTFEPRENKPVLRFETSAGTEETYDVSLFTAYRKNGWGFDLAAESLKTDGYIPIVESARGAVDTQAGSRHNNIFLTIEKRWSEPPASADGSAFENFNARIFLRGNYFTENRNNGTFLQYNQTRFRQLAAGADFASEKIGAFQLRSFLESQIYDQTFSAVSDDRNSENLTRLQRVPSQAFGASLFWNRVFANHIVSASFEFRQTRGFSDEIGFFGGRATSASSSGGSERTVSVFAQDVWRLSRKLSLNFGGRFDSWENYAARSTTRTFVINEALIVNFSDRRETAFSPRLAALYRINDRFSFIASYARSFRAPTLNELYRGFRVGSVVTLPNENLQAEIAATYETGLNYSGLRNRLSIRGNFFYTEVAQPIFSVTVLTAPTLITRQRQNVGETRARGLEVDAEYAPRRDLRFSASYLLVDSRVTKFPANPALIGKFLPQVARQQFTFQTVYRPREKLSLSFQGRISDVQFEDDLNTLRLRPYFTLDAFGAYRLPKNFEIFAAVENIFDNRYDIGRTPVLTIAAPRFVRVGLRFNLNGK